MTHRPICSECGEKAELVAGVKVYPHRRDLWGGKFWLCSCGAYVGCHPGTTEPLGSPAGQQTRRLRQRVHAALDPLWVKKMNREGISRKKARGAAYEWLAAQVGTPVDQTHIGMFTADQCRLALEALRKAKEKTTHAEW